MPKKGSHRSCGLELVEHLGEQLGIAEPWCVKCDVEQNKIQPGYVWEIRGD